MFDAAAPRARELAVNGGEPAAARFEGRPPAKIGAAEFMELARVWGFDARTLAAIEAAVSDADLGDGPWLIRYHNPRPAVVDELEALARDLFASPYALAVHSGTSALECAYAACAIGPGDEVIVPGYTFLATAAAVVTAGAIPVIAEVDESLTLDPRDVEAKITERTAAIVPVHMLGAPADMDAMRAIATSRDVRLIEDVAQACGASYRARRLGTFGDCGCFSISSFKAVGGGEGGLVLTRDEIVHVRAQNQHDTAACWRPDRYARERFPGELFCGSNARMSEIEGAVNLVQLRRMDERVERFRLAKRRVLEELRGFDEIEPQRRHDPDGELGNHIVFFAPTGDEAREVARALSAEGVKAWGCGFGSGARDWHLYAYWDQILERKSVTGAGWPWTGHYHRGELPDYRPDMCPRTLSLVARVVIVPVSEGWSADDCRLVASGINKVLEAGYDSSGGSWES